ncbi:MAG: replicative DNA helicase [Gammaproteobacteria bacterium]|nr:replicative DNA helicase [Gammaproteobacteria bacterium]MDE0246787.1 replicative DNA helicase [Gammaproteobacteria bacterium]
MPSLKTVAGTAVAARYDREPPYSFEAEISVLAGILLDEAAMVRIEEVIDASMFFREAHRILYRAMRQLQEKRTAVDPVTVGDHLRTRGELERAGGIEYLAELIDAVPTAANVQYHARIVRDKALLRRLIDASTRTIQDVYEPGERSVDDLVDEAEARIFQVAETHDRGGFVWIKDLLWDAMENIEKLQENTGGLTGVPSGFRRLDRMTTGLQSGDLVIVAARPAMGKTSWVLNVAQSAAIRHKVPVAVFSLEMSKEQVVFRLLCSEARVDAQALRQGRLRAADYQRIGSAAAYLNAAPIWIDDSPSGTVLEMRAKARRLKAEGSLGLLVIDYLQLMEGSGRFESRQQEVAQISRGLKALARELNVPVIAVSQLSRAPEQRGGDRRPQLSDLRDSGSIEQDADLVMFLYRPEYYSATGVDEDGNSLEGKAELIVSKQRNGPTGRIDLFFNKQYTRFDDLAEDGDAHGTDRAGGARA